jgi:stage III sporulation protein AH
MNVQETWGSIKNFCRRIGKRNWMIVGAVALIGTAICLNFALFGDVSAGGFDYNDGQETEAGGGAQETEPSGSVDADSYFSAVQVSRQRARDEALEVLQSIVDSENADEAARNEALKQIAKLAEEMSQESGIESLVVAKGFEACVAVISNGSASIVVKGEGLLPAQLSQINEIVYEQAGIAPVNVTIIERQ